MNTDTSHLKTKSLIFKKNIMNNLTKNEQKLNQLIEKINTNFTTPKRDIVLKEVLQYVTTISQDGSLNKLLKTIKNHFPEYGS